MPRTRTWLPDEDAVEIVSELANAGYSLGRSVETLAARGVIVTRSALSAFANRNGIEFHGKQPPWTTTRKRNHRRAMQLFWQCRKRGSLSHASD